MLEIQHTYGARGAADRQRRDRTQHQLVHGDVLRQATISRRIDGHDRLAVDQHVLHPGMQQLEAHEHGEGHRHEAERRRRHEIEDADVLVVRRHEPAGEEPRMPVIVVRVDNGVGHDCFS